MTLPPQKLAPIAFVADDVVSTIMIGIETQLIKILIQFDKLISDATDKKSKTPLDTPAMQTLLSHFPHNNAHYTKCVNDFVLVFRDCPELGIEALYKWLPGSDNTFYSNITKHMTDYQLQGQLNDLLLFLFFVDCVTQILPDNPSQLNSDLLLVHGYHLAQPIPSHQQWQFPFRLQIIKQYSVIFSRLSTNSLLKIFDNLPSRANAADLSLFFILHRFIKLCFSPPFDTQMIARFLSQFVDLYEKCPPKSFSKECWAASLTTLFKQITPDFDPAINAIFERAYHIIVKKIDNTAQGVLAITILMRHKQLHAKYFKTFYADSVKKIRANNIVRSLSIFLTILHGTYCSRTTQFWEWGEYNVLAHPGITISHVNQHEQDQRDPDSYSHQFLNYFCTSDVILSQPELLADAMVNLAARDIRYFVSNTLKDILAKFGDRSIHFLIPMLSVFLDPTQHFAEFVQQNAFNIGIRVSENVAELVSSLNETLYRCADQWKSKELSQDAFCFTLTDSIEVPIFSLPIQTMAISNPQRQRIKLSTTEVTRILNEWEFLETPNRAELKAEFTVIDTVTESEASLIRLIGLIPWMIRKEDYETLQPFNLLLGLIISSSRAVALYSVQILNQIFTSNMEGRIAIYGMILDHLGNQRVIRHAYILIELLLRLLNLALPVFPEEETEIPEFLDKAQATIMYLLTLPSAEIRDCLLLLIDRLHKFAVSLKCSFPLHDIFKKCSQSMALAVEYKACLSVCSGNLAKLFLPQTLVPVKTALSSRYDVFVLYNLRELANRASYALDTRALYLAQKLIIKALSEVSDDRTTFFSSLMCVATNLVHTSNTPENEGDFKGKYTAFYEDLPLARIHDSDELDFESNLNAMIEILSQNFNNEKVRQIYKFINWRVTASIIPRLTTISLHTAVNILFLLSQDPDFNLALSLSLANKVSIIQLITKVEKFFVEKRMTGTRRVSNFSGDLSDNYILASQYCIILQHFIHAVSVKSDIDNEGPIHIPAPNSFLGEQGWSIRNRRDSFLMLMNWTRLMDDVDMQMYELGKMATQTLCAFVKLGPIFEDIFVMTEDMERLFLDVEKQGQPILRHLLQFHHDYMFDAFINHMYEAPPDIAPLFFMAICFQYFDETKDSLNSSFVMKYTQNIRTSLGSSSIRPFSKLSRSGHLIKHQIEQAIVELNQEEIDINYQLVLKSGQLIPCGLLNLLHDDFTIRSNSYRFLIRIAPVIHTIIYPEDTRGTAQFVHDLQQFATSFFSSFITITKETVLKVTNVFAQYLPNISELVIRDIFERFKDAAHGSFLTSSNRAFVLDIASAFISKIEINPQLDIAPEFIVFTPSSLLKIMLDILPLIECASMPNYLSIWTSFSNTGSNIESMISFLMASAENKLNEMSVKTVLVHLAAINEKVVGQLSFQLSFGAWYYSNVSIHLSENEPPLTNDLSTSMTSIVYTLTELAQTNFEPLRPLLHIILNYALLHYEPGTTLFAELLLVIVNTIVRNGDEIVQAFMPPASLIWDGQNNDFRNSAMSVAMHPTEKKRISVTTFVSKFVTYLNKADMPETVTEWGSECLKWACSCGDLKIASRAAMVFSVLMTPFDNQTVQSLCHSVETIGRSPYTPEGSEYLISIFRIMLSAIGQDVDNIQLLFSSTEPFLAAPERNEICFAALGIVTQYVMQLNPTKKDMKKLLARIAQLFGQIRPHDTLIAALVTIFQREKENKSSPLGVAAFSVFLPYLYTCFAAYHNVQPYASELTDDMILPALQTMILLKKAKFLPGQVRDHLIDSHTSIGAMRPHEFLLKMCSGLYSRRPKTITEIGHLLASMAAHADSILLSGIFEVAARFYDVGVPADSFVVIVKQAASKPLPASTSLLQAYLRRNPVSHAVAATPESPSGWKAVQDRMFDRKRMEIPPDQYVIENPIELIPLCEPMWKCEEIKARRDLMKNLQVEPFSSTNEKLLDMLDRPITSRGSVLVVPKHASTFLRYRDEALV